MSSNQINDADSCLLEKITFIATALASETVSLACWATNWFDFGPELAKYVGTRIVNWWSKRRRTRDAKDLIDQLKIKLMLDSDQVIMLKQLVDFVREDDEDLRKMIATDKPLNLVCVERLTRSGFDQVKAERAVALLVDGLREVLIVAVAPTDMYREQMVTRKTAREMLSLQKKVIRETSRIGLSIPNSFTPLDRRLDHDIIIDAFDRYLKGHDVVLPQSILFRRPHPNWIDLAEDRIFMREDVIERIERNFQETNMQLVIGESGAGKTTLSFILGFRRLTAFRGDRHAVFYLDFVDCDPNLAIRDIRTIVERTVELRSIDNQAVSRVLVIFDNIHTNPKCLRTVYEKMRMSRLSKQEAEIPLVDFLFLARPLKKDMNAATEDMILRIVGTPSAQGLLRTLVLKRPEFRRAVIGICESYLRMQLVEEYVDVNPLAWQVARKSKWSLWLVSFVLQAVESARQVIGCIPADLSDLNVCEPFEQYYLDQLQALEEIDDYITLSRQFSMTEGSRSVFWAFLILLSVFNRFDVPVSEGLIHEVIELESGTRYHREFVNLVRDLLLARGEIVRVGRGAGLAFPHTTLANQMFHCSSWAKEKMKPGIGTFNRSIINRKPIEWCKQLLDSDAPTSLMKEVVSGFVAGESSDNLNDLLNWLFNNHELLLNIVSTDMRAFSIFVDRAIWYNRPATLDLVAEVLSLDSVPLTYIAAFDRLLFGYPIHEDEGVRKAFFDRFRKTDSLIDVLSAAVFTGFEEDSEFLGIVEERLEDLEGELRNTESPEEVLDVYLSYPLLLESIEINNAAMERIPDLAIILESTERSPRLISTISTWKGLVEDVRIRKLISEQASRLAQMITSEEWWIIRVVARIEYLHSDECILQALVELVKNTDNPLKALGFISEDAEFMKNVAIQKELDERIPDMASSLKTLEIDEFVWIAHLLKTLVQREAIKEALEYRVPEFLEIAKAEEVNMVGVHTISFVGRLIENEQLLDAAQGAYKKIRNTKPRFRNRSV